MTNPRRLKFIWGASRVIRGRWFLGLVGLYDRTEGTREDGIAVSVRGLLLWGGGLALAGWVALTAAVWGIWQRNPHNLLTYADAFFYPVRRSEIAERKGQAFLAEGTELARAGRWQEAEKLLRLGLARYPRDLPARLSLAQIYQGANQHALAFQTLQDGLGADYPGRAYLTALIRLTALGENYDAVAAACARYLPVVEKKGLTLERRWLLERQHEALLAAGRHAEALALAEAEPAGAMRDERRVLALLGLGRSAEALTLLADWRLRPGADLRHVTRLEARAFREAGRGDDLERALDELRRLSPDDPAALIYGIVQRVMAGRESTARASFAEFVFRFGGFPEHLAQLAAPLAEVGNLPLLEACVAAAHERGFPLGPFDVHLIDTHLLAGNWAEAQRRIESVTSPAEAQRLAGRIWRNWLTALVTAARDPAEPAQQALVEFLQGQSWALGIYRRTLSVLARAERWTTARHVTDLGLRAYPDNPWLLQQAADIKGRLAALPAPSAAVIPDRPVPPSSHTAPHPESVESLVAQLNTHRTAGDQPALRRTARLLLTGDRARAERAVSLAREWARAGDRPAAERLLRDVLQRHEGFPPALRLQRELDPAATETK